MAFSKMPFPPKGGGGKMKAKTATPAPKAVYKQRVAKPEPDMYPKKPPKVGAPAVNKARMKRLKGVAL
jgi:hypothetical protein